MDISYDDYDWSAWDNAANDYMAQQNIGAGTQTSATPQSIRDTIAMMEANGMTDSEIAYVLQSSGNADAAATLATPLVNTTSSNLLKDFGKSISNLLTGKSDLGSLGSLAGFGGLAALLKQMTGSGSAPVIGYQGGIPKYTISREQTPIAQQRPAGYRPGQGGITYFNPTTYSTGTTGTTGGTGGTPAVVSPPLGSPGDGGDGSSSSTSSQSGISKSLAPFEPLPYLPPFERPVEAKIIYADPSLDPTQAAKTIMPVSDSRIEAATGGYMPGIAGLAGGRFLRGPGDGVSDSIKARFTNSGEPARLADGEFVLDARTVSEIGNGSSEAGARKLYEMVDRIHKARKTAQRGKPSNADKSLPA